MDAGARAHGGAHGGAKLCADDAAVLVADVGIAHLRAYCGADHARADDRALFAADVGADGYAQLRADVRADHASAVHGTVLIAHVGAHRIAQLRAVSCADHGVPYDRDAVGVAVFDPGPRAVG